MLLSRAHFCLIASILATACLTGCSSGQKSGRPDIDAIPEVELRGASDKKELHEFRAKVKKRGVSAAKQDLPDLIASLENYEKFKLGAHKETYKQIVEKLKAMQADLAGSPTRESVTKFADELGALADKLPGTANANPTVE